jgi:hypothetical protein
VVPEKRWIVCQLITIESKGRGRGEVMCSSRPVLFVSHHAMSRAAQRLGMRTSEDMIDVAKAIWSSAVDLHTQKDFETWQVKAPEAGWRIGALIWLRGKG